MNDVLQAVHCPSMKQVMVLERFAKEFKLYDYNMNFVKKIELPKQNNLFITSVAFDDNSLVYGVAATDKKVYFFKKGKVKYDFLYSIETPCVQNKIWFIQNKQIWLSAGRDYKMRQYEIEKSSGKIMREDFLRHEDEITDCIGILTPSCIATCSLDQTIIMFDLVNGTIIRQITEKHEKGIFHLRY